MLDRCCNCKNDFRKREIKYKFCSITCANLYNRNGLHQVTLPLENVDLAEFVGICLGDGHVSKYQVAVTLNASADRDYVPYVATLMKKLFPGVTVSLIIRKRDNAIDVRLNSIIAADFLRSIGIVSNAKKIPSWIKADFSYSNACMRGLFDTEGSISFKRYRSKRGISIYKQLNFRNNDIQLMRFVRDTLAQLGLKPTMTLKKSLYLSSHTSIALFRENVGFRNPKLLKRSLITDINSYAKFCTELS